MNAKVGLLRLVKIGRYRYQVFIVPKFSSIPTCMQMVLRAGYRYFIQGEKRTKSITKVDLSDFILPSSNITRLRDIPLNSYVTGSSKLNWKFHKITWYFKITPDAKYFYHGSRSVGYQKNSNIIPRRGNYLNKILFVAWTLSQIHGGANVPT